MNASGQIHELIQYRAQFALCLPDDVQCVLMVDV